MKTRRINADPIDRGRFPLDPWRLVELHYSPEDLGVSETLFSVANGYLGMRGNPEEGRDAYEQGQWRFHDGGICHCDARCHRLPFEKADQLLVLDMEADKAVLIKMGRTIFLPGKSLPVQHE